MQKMLPWKKERDNRRDEDQISLTRASWLLQKASRVFTNRKVRFLIRSSLAITVLVVHFTILAY